MTNKSNGATTQLLPKLDFKGLFEKCKKRLIVEKLLLL